ncbi:FtsX-like permease family protein [Streptomyces sp. 2RAF24]|uniref:FtsX-like permease family protein n=1 Tax=Streptomyces sp. 2RAF24 TaxID=3232997 RepID=UPI003F9D791D
MSGLRGSPTAVRLLAARSLRAHRRAWAAVFAAVTLVSLLLGSLALTAGSLGLAHARVERYAAADVVVAADQNVRWTTKPWASEPVTTTAPLTERIGVPTAVAELLRGVEGVRAVVPDDGFVVRDAGDVRDPRDVRGAQVAARDAQAAVRDPQGVREYPGRSWETARLGGYGLTAGRAPSGAGEVVAGAGLGAGPGEGSGAGQGAGTGPRIGQYVAGYRVVGLADGPAALYFSAAEAGRLAGHPGRHDAIGVLGAPGVPVATLHARVRQALDASGAGELRAFTGNGRGGVEDLRALPARDGLLQLLAAVAATVVLVTVLVLTSLVAQALQQRAPERELLYAIGATPRQVRAAVGREVNRVAGAAAVLGALGAVPAFLALRAELRGRGLLPATLELPAPPWLFTGALVTAGLTVGLARCVVVLAAARRDRAPARRPGGVRQGFGVALLVVGAGSAGTATLQAGQAAGAAAGAATVTLVAGCALLGPWLAAAAMRVLGPVPRRFGGAPGRLVAAGAVAHSRRLGAALVPIVLVSAFATVQLAAGATMERAAAEQARAAMVADYAVGGSGAPVGSDGSGRSGPSGRSEGTAAASVSVADIRRMPGVTAVTGLVRSTVVLARTEAGSPRLDRLPVLGVDAEGLAETLDPGVVAGDLAGLARPGTVAVGADRADSLEVRPGSTVEVRFDDGALRRLTVVAVYERSLALGEFLLPRAELAAHMADPRPARVLVAGPGGAAVAGAMARPEPEQVVPDEAEASGLVSACVVAAIGALTVLSVLSTLALVAAGRRGELGLLHQVGASRRQLRRMLRLEAAFLAGTGLVIGGVVAALPLAAFSWALTGGPPYLPPLQAALIAGTVILTTYAGTVVLSPVGRR